MSSTIPFIKYSATGNDFILIDNRRRILNGDETALLHEMCGRKTGIGADGILLIENPRRADCTFTMRYFNRDGRESEMCGNGARASAYHAHTHGIAPAEMYFEVSGDRYHARVENDRVRLRMQPPYDLRPQPGALKTLEQPIALALEEGGFVNTGVPHYIVFVNDVSKAPVTALGRTLRHHPAFAPAGANVNFVEMVSPSHLKLRTYERGVEEETLACGTGAVASAWLAHLRHHMSFPINLTAPGGELCVEQESVSGRLTLAGNVRKTFTGEYLRCD